jgi:hypothetical protein
VKDRLLRIAFAVLIALAIPTAAVLARGSIDGSRAGAGGSATEVDAPRQDPAGAANRPHNHGWYVSQAAKNKSTQGRGHGQAVSKVAHGNQGKAAKTKP